MRTIKSKKKDMKSSNVFRTHYSVAIEGEGFDPNEDWYDLDAAMQIYEDELAYWHDQGNVGDPPQLFKIEMSVSEMDPDAL